MGRRSGAGESASKKARPLTRLPAAPEASLSPAGRGASETASLPIGGTEVRGRFDGAPACPKCGTVVAPGVRNRADGFTPAKRRAFLDTLAKTGCVSDGARIAGISTVTVDRWRRRDAVFSGACEAALQIASSHIETLAWERAVTGIEEPIWNYGKQVGTRVKRSDSIFRLLLQASNKKKFGRQGVSGARRPAAKARKKIEAEARAEIAAAQPDRDEMVDALKLRLMGIEARLCGGLEPETLDDPAYGEWLAERKRRELEKEMLYERWRAGLPLPAPDG